MRVRLVQVPRRLGWPAWAIAAVLAWAALIGLASWYAQRKGVELRLCLFRRVTGYPCPTCGATRGALSLLRGDVAGAWRLNPLLLAALAAAAVVLAARVLLGRAVQVEWTRGERIAAWIAAGALVLLNWAYLIRCVG